MRSSHTLGVFEGGVSKPREMTKVAPMIDCSIGIFTNIGSAHDEGFESRDQKVVEKSLLFTQTKKLICSSDHPMVIDQLRLYFPDRLMTWSLKGNTADIEGYMEGHQLTFHYRKVKHILQLPFVDEASVENVMHCITVMLHLGYGLNIIQERIQWLHRLPLRLELIQGARGNLVINDCYNADLESFQIALDFMEQHAGDRPRTLVISDFHQVGHEVDRLYQRMSAMIMSKPIYKVISIGEKIQKIELPDDVKVHHYTSTEQLVNDLDDVFSHDEIILVKGARAFEMERICNRLLSQTHAAELEVDLSALLQNLSTYKAILPKSTKVMVMVKAAAYGGGAREISTVLQYHHIDYVGVAYADEGVQLREQGLSLPILVLNPDWSYLDRLHRYHLEPEVYSMEGLIAVGNYQKDTGHQLKVHLKIDTGMHRLGFTRDDLSDLTDYLKASNIFVQSIFTHLAACDDPAKDDFTNSQLAQFDQTYSTIVDVLGYRPIRHILNSVGILRQPSHTYEMVRLGKGVYGIDLPEDIKPKFERVHTLKARISQIKKVKKGGTIGYNAKETLVEEKITATVNIGYADGVPRSAGNGKARFLVRDHLVPTVGNICMDMFMMDISGLGDIQIGDEVEIYGKRLPIESQSRDMNTIPLELLCGISSRVRRLYFQA